MDIDVIGLERIVRGMIDGPATIGQQIDESLDRIIDHVVPNVQKYTPVWKGTLKGAIEGNRETDGNIHTAIINANAGAVAPVVVASVESGAVPHWPPWGKGSNLAEWAKDKGIPPFLVARAIARKGTIKRFGYGGARMFERGLEDSQAFIDAESDNLGVQISAELIKP